MRSERDQLSTLALDMAKYIAQILLAGSRILGRAFAKALQEEYAASQQAAKARASSRANDSSSRDGGSFTDSLSGISLEEAKQILNIQDIRNSEELQKKFDHLFSVNAKSKGGSLYLQSKVFRAKERIDEELRTLDSTPPSSESAKPPDP
ncbi:mitochondrial import inner membrane translocase subunit TIM16 [Sparganum proliferum]